MGHNMNERQKEAKENVYEVDALPSRVRRLSERPGRWTVVIDASGEN
jgi:hypothetical protein